MCVCFVALNRICLFLVQALYILICLSLCLNTYSRPYAVHQTNALIVVFLLKLQSFGPHSIKRSLFSYFMMVRPYT